MNSFEDDWEEYAQLCRVSSRGSWIGSCQLDVDFIDQTSMTEAGGALDEGVMQCPLVDLVSLSMEKAFVCAMAASRAGAQSGS